MVRVSRLWKVFSHSEPDVDVRSESRASSIDSGHQSASPGCQPYENEDCVGVLYVEINADQEDIGIVLNGGADQGLCPSISSLKPGSTADRCDRLQPGDRITSVNGIRTTKLQHDELTKLLHNVNDKAVLGIEYPLPRYPSESSLCASTKITQVTLCRENGSLGLTLRGGAHPDPTLSRPLIITHIRPNGPADRQGTIKAGDRLVGVDGTSLRGATLADAQTLLNIPSERPLTLSIEYDINILESVRSATGPLLVEVERNVEVDFGLTLSSDVSGSVIIEAIKPGSLAERCGALHVGDQILAVGDTKIHSGISVNEVSKWLQSSPHLTLEILPLSQLGYGWRLIESSQGFQNSKLPGQLVPSPSPSGFSTLSSCYHVKSSKSGSSAHVGYNSRLGLSHSETIDVTLYPDQHGYGLAVQLTNTVPPTIIITNIEPGSPADRSGCLQTGDRVLSINQKSLQSGELLIEDIEKHINNTDGSALTLHVEFDVLDTVVPDSGIFSVKLANKGNGLGITITSSKYRLPGEPPIISDIRRGSAAHRTGTLLPGDKLLAIDSLKLDQCSLEDTQHILQSCSDIVTLRVQKDDIFSELAESSNIVYTVELSRNNGPLGITIAGSEEPFEPITITGLIDGGPAQQSGVLQLGDRLLAINGHSLKGRPLSEAITLLQSSSDIVTLKVSRSNAKGSSITSEAMPTLLSVDSALESWDGNNGIEEYKSESATVRRKQKYSPCSSTTQRPPSLDSGQSGAVLEHWDKCVGVDMDNTPIPSSGLECSNQRDSYIAPSPLPLSHYLHNNSLPRSRPTHHVEDNSSFGDMQVYQVVLFKDSVYEDFGFSVSDGLYERGVYVNRIRRGGPADLSGMLRPYDRILQVNETRTQDFDCCLTVPLIASAGERLELMIGRSNTSSSLCNKDENEDLWQEDNIMHASTLGLVTKTL